MLDEGRQFSNVALNKAATQSSRSIWSVGTTIEEDARVANNGDLLSAISFHTADEASPWWQVDLGGPFAIKQIRIYNRRDQASRLRRFTILVSESGEPESWLAIGAKADDSVFGGTDDAPYVVKPADTYLARFVRVRKDGGGFLHFRECEIIGYSPSLAEVQTLRDKTEDKKRRGIDETAQRERSLVEGRKGFVAYIDANAIFVDTENYTKKLVNALTSGIYEGRERKVLANCLLSKDRVLEVGTALGAVSMAVARLIGPDRVMTFDANPAMVADARRNFAANGFSAISANVGVLRNRSRWRPSEREIDFFVSKDFWASRLFARPDAPDIVRVVKAPLVRLEDKIAEHKANVLVCDIEGGEIDLLLEADLDSVRLIMMEIHPWMTGREPINKMIRYLVTKGFDINFRETGSDVIVLDRVLENGKA